MKNLTNIAPVTSPNSVCCKRIRVDNIENRERFLDGGLRTRDIFKRRDCSNLPLVSIVTVCLNSRLTIKKCIESVLSQSYDNIEYIIVDGGSDDGTLDIIMENEKEIDYFVSEPDTGLYNAMNKGLSLCLGSYILLLNSDDWYENRCVDTLVKKIKENDVDFVSALANYVDNRKDIYNTCAPTR